MGLFVATTSEAGEIIIACDNSEGCAESFRGNETEKTLEKAKVWCCHFLVVLGMFGMHEVHRVVHG